MMGPIAALFLFTAAPGWSQSANYEFNDSHFHLTNIIWAHMGLGRTVRPGKNHAMQMEEILKDPDFDQVYFDLAWDEVAKYFVGGPEATAYPALPGPLSVWHGCSSTGRSIQILSSLQSIPAFVEFSRCKDFPESETGKLRTNFR
jgi:hypothetical protein